MKIVAIESPYKPSPEDLKRYEGRFSEGELLRQNLLYARLALAHSLSLGEAPCASHLLYTQVWTEDADLREAGIRAGLEFYQRIDAAAHYVDLGRSAGMKRAEKHAELVNVQAERRVILAEKTGDPRDYLSKLPWPETGFPYLEELLNAERGSMGRIRAHQP